MNYITIHRWIVVGKKSAKEKDLRISLEVCRMNKQKEKLKNVIVTDMPPWQLKIMMMKTVIMIITRKSMRVKPSADNSLRSKRLLKNVSRYFSHHS